MPSVASEIINAGKYIIYKGIAGVNAADIVIETVDVMGFDTFMLSCGAGSVYVEVHDSVQWLTAPLSMADLGAVDNVPVLVAAALRQYGWRGRYQAVRVRQSGATAATGSVLRIG